VSYLARDTARPEEPPVLFSGGSLLAGRFHALICWATNTTGLAHQLYRSLHETILPPGDDVIVHPTTAPALHRRGGRGIDDHHWVHSGKLQSIQVRSGKRQGLRIELRRDEIGLFAQS